MDRRIETYETDPDIFITLKPGWQYDGAHCFGEDTHADVKRTMKRVKPCHCNECLDLAAVKQTTMGE
jgi:hypothetical protein